MLINQRSKEWINILKKYDMYSINGITEVDGTTFEEWVMHYYYLTRGCCIEYLISNFCDFSKILDLDVIKFNCGILIESKKKYEN